MDSLIDTLLKLLPYALLQSIAYGVYWLYLEIKQQKEQKRTPQARRYHQTQSKVDPSTRNRLLSMVGGDQGTCYRLVEYSRARNPGLSEQQCWERAIEELIRDRR